MTELKLQLDKLIDAEVKHINEFIEKKDRTRENFP